MFKNGLILLSSTFFAKVAPLILGYLVTIFSSQNSYSVFVSFLLFSNLMSNVSILGVSPQIIALKGTSEDKNKKYLQIVLCGFLLLFCCSLLMMALCKFNIVQFYLIDSLGLVGGILASLYSLGLYCIYVSTANLNNALKTRQASIIWFCFSNITIISMVIWLLMFRGDLLLLLSLMAFSSVLVGIISFIYSIDNRKALCYRGLYCDSLVVYRKILKKLLSYSLFGFGVVGVFFYYQNSFSLKSVADGTYFSLIYQVFSLIIFVPATLGNIVVPLMVRKVKKVAKPIIYLYYFFISFVLCLIIVLIYPRICMLYNIDIQQYEISYFIVYMVVSLVASVHSYSIQILVSDSKYNVLLISTCIWAFSSLMMTAWLDISVQSVSISLSAAYLISSSLVWLRIYTLGYFKGYE